MFKREEGERRKREKKKEGGKRKQKQTGGRRKRNKKNLPYEDKNDGRKKWLTYTTAAKRNVKRNKN